MSGAEGTKCRGNHQGERREQGVEAMAVPAAAYRRGFHPAVVALCEADSGRSLADTPSRRPRALVSRPLLTRCQISLASDGAAVASWQLSSHAPPTQGSYWGGAPSGDPTQNGLAPPHWAPGGSSPVSLNPGRFPLGGSKPLGRVVPRPGAKTVGMSSHTHAGVLMGRTLVGQPGSSTSRRRRTDGAHVRAVRPHINIMPYTVDVPN